MQFKENNKKQQRAEIVKEAKTLADGAAGWKLKIRRRFKQRVCKSSHRMDVAVVIAVVVVVSTIPYRDNGVNEPHTSTTAHSILCVCLCVLVCVNVCVGQELYISAWRVALADICRELSFQVAQTEKLILTDSDRMDD